MAEGSGTIIECPDKENIILFNFRKMGHWGAKEEYYDYLFNETVGDDAFRKISHIIVSGMEYTTDVMYVLKKILDVPKSERKLKEIFFQGRRAEYRTDKNMHHGKNNDLVDFLVENFKLLKYSFFEDTEYFRSYYFCSRKSKVEFLLMNSQTKSLPKLNYYRRNKHRGWSLKLKNFVSKKSMTFTQGVEDIEELELHKMMKKYFEKPKTHVLKTSFYKNLDEVEGKNLLRNLNPKIIFASMGCPKESNKFVMPCTVVEKSLVLKRLRKVEKHTIICGHHSKKIQINNFDLAFYTNTPTRERMDIISYSLDDDSYKIRPVLYDEDNFKHPCDGHSADERVFFEWNGIEEFKRYMSDPDELDRQVEMKNKKDAEDKVLQEREEEERKKAEEEEERRRKEEEKENQEIYIDEEDSNDLDDDDINEEIDHESHDHKTEEL